MANLDETTTERASIYAIYEGAGADVVVYVGKTTYQRDGQRFIEHVNNDKDYPWYKDKHSDKAYADDTDTNWPYYPRKLEDCKDFTPLEIAASEEFWWEKFGGLEGKLINKNQPITRDTFRKYKTAQTFRAEIAKLFPKTTWEPKQ